MKKHILVVEDDAHIRLGLCDALRAEGYEVTDCRDGAQAGPLIATLEAMLADASAYGSHAAHFGTPPQA